MDLCSSRIGLWKPVRVHCQDIQESIQHGKLLDAASNCHNFRSSAELKLTCIVSGNASSQRLNVVRRPRPGHSIISSGRVACCCFWAPVITSSFLCYCTHSNTLAVWGKVCIKMKITTVSILICFPSLCIFFQFLFSVYEFVYKFYTKLFHLTSIVLCHASFHLMLDSEQFPVK